MNISSKASGKQVLGVMVDGTDLRIAHMGWEKGEIVIHALEAVVLPARLGRIGAAQPVAAIDSEENDIFGIDETGSIKEPFLDMVGPQDQDLAGAIINIFSKYNLGKNKIAVNIPEGQATYYSFESDFGLSGKKLHKRLVDEISPLAGGTLDTATIDHFQLESGGMMVVVSEGNIPLIEELIDVKNYLKGGQPYFCNVDSNEIALVNLVRQTMDLQEDKVTALVYIGNDFSRVILMRGNEPISFIQAIREGYQSPQVCQTLFSKILLEQEEAGIPEIDNIVLAGEIGISRAHEFFKDQFPEADVRPISPGQLDTNLLKSEELAILPNLAIPIAIAWKALDKNNPKWIGTNLMPHSVKETQKVFKIAWHGFALLGLIFAGMLLLSYQGITRFSSINNLEDSIQLKQASLAALEPQVIFVNQLQEQVNTFKANLDFLDTIIIDPTKWSRLFGKLSEDFKNVNRIWIVEIQSTDYGFTMIGKASSRDRIPVLAAGFEGVDLKWANRVISESGEIAYEFQIDAEIPPPPYEEPVQPEVTSDRASSTKGSIEVKTEAISQVTEKEQKPTSNNQTAGSPLMPQKLAEEPTGPSSEGKKETKSDDAGSGKSLFKAQKIALKDASRDDQQNQLAKAESRPTPLLEQSKLESADTHYNRGIRYIKARKIDAALQEFEALIGKYPEAKQSASAFYWIGECYYTKKQYEKAIKSFENSLESPNKAKRPAAMVMLGMSYLKLKHNDKARTQFEALLEAFPEGEYAETSKKKLSDLSK